MCKFYKINLLFIVLISLSGCKKETVSTDKEQVITEQKEVENAKQLKETVIHFIANEIDSKDTIFISINRDFPICGNDERFDGIETPEEKEAKLNYIKANPYFIDYEKDYENKYVINNKVVILGTTFENEFNSNLLNFDYSKDKSKAIYDLVFSTIKKDTVQAMVYNVKNSDESDNAILNMELVLNDSEWMIK